jgi:hypothetical protein
LHFYTHFFAAMLGPMTRGIELRRHESDDRRTLGDRRGFSAAAAYNGPRVESE